MGFVWQGYTLASASQMQGIATAGLQGRTIAQGILTRAMI